MGLCSYLLIGFWYAKPSARDAAVKAFMTTRIGDVFMLLGIAFVYSATGTLSFREIFQPQVLHTLATRADPHSGTFGCRPDRLAALHRHGWQVGAVPAARVAARCHGRPDPGQRHDPCGHHGFGRRLHGHPHVPAAEPGPAHDDHRGIHRRIHGLVRRDDCGRAERHQARAGLFDHLAAWLHDRRAGCRRLCGRRIPPRDPCLLQGVALPRLRLGHSRHGARRAAYREA